ncbi:MAG: hypothetical protein M3N16_00545 [Actinomycetota bacterium]|nr:hypothetical protein [Actinomycetota bacterium]
MKLESGVEDLGGEETLRFHAMLNALADLGAVSSAECRGWRERRESARRGREPRSAPLPYVPAELRRVVAGPPQRADGVRLICAELWDDRVVLRWHRVMSAEEVAAAERHRLQDESSEPMEDWRRAAETFELRDDLGTRYEAQLLGSGEDGPAVGVTVALAMASEPQPVWAGRSSCPRSRRRRRAWRPSAARIASCWSWPDPARPVGALRAGDESGRHVRGTGGFR